jgi:hypothetical protein
MKMRRGEFIAGLGAAVVPLAAGAQQPKVPVIGFLDFGTSEWPGVAPALPSDTYRRSNIRRPEIPTFVA